MCNKHSFVMDNEGKIYNGYGLIESHTTICSIHELNDDKVNKYEYNPNNTQHYSYGITGLNIDTEVFTVTLNMSKQIETYIDTYFSDVESWEKYSNIIAPASILKQLSTDSNWNVRRTVAQNINTPVSILEQMSTDSDCDVRSAVAQQKGSLK